MTSSGKPPRFKRYIRGVLIALDRLFNAIFFGRDAETISSRVGRHAERGKRWALITEKVINWLMGPNHCRSCIGS